MYGRYRSPAGCSKLEHHSVCVTRPIIVRLMNYCFATLAIILLSPSVSATVHGTEIRLEIWPEPDLGKRGISDLPEAKIRYNPNNE